MGAVSVTWDEHYRTPFAPLVPGASWAGTDDPALLDDLVTDQTAAIVVEPIRGEGGVRPISRELAQAITAACARTGALLITDEVQSGSGRTGTFLHGPTLGLRADLVALAKALGAGVPVGAVVMSTRIAESIVAGDHGTTYGGNLLACRAALTFLDVLEGGVQMAMHRVSTYLFDRLRALAATSNGAVVEVRGAGFIAGLELAADALPVVNGALDRGLVINRTSSTVVRLLPAYIANERDVDEAVGILDASIRATL